LIPFSLTSKSPSETQIIPHNSCQFLQLKKVAENQSTQDVSVLVFGVITPLLEQGVES
jgi:hypothetical protein